MTINVNKCNNNEQNNDNNNKSNDGICLFIYHICLPLTRLPLLPLGLSAVFPSFSPAFPLPFPSIFALFLDLLPEVRCLAIQVSFHEPLNSVHLFGPVGWLHFLPLFSSSFLFFSPLLFFLEYFSFVLCCVYLGIFLLLWDELTLVGVALMNEELVCMHVFAVHICVTCVLARALTCAYVNVRFKRQAYSLKTSFQNHADYDSPPPPLFIQLIRNTACIILCANS